MTASGESIPRIIILGAGLGGAVAAFEIKHAVENNADVRVISDSEMFSFTPSNPWVALGWRKAEAIQVALRPVFDRKRIGFVSKGAKRLLPEQNRIELADGSLVDYDYLVIATGPDLAFDEIPGLGPHGGFSVSVCQTAHAVEAAKAFEGFCATPGPVIVGAAQGASCFRTGL
jgi:sulfide:quinone oxidoreductase